MKKGDHIKTIIWHPYTQMLGSAPAIHISKAKGAYLFDKNGKKYIDAISSWWVNTHGHAHPHIANAITKQCKVLEQVIFAGFTHTPALKLSEKLVRHLPKGQKKLFFSDDGSTSVEVALKMALQFWFNKKQKRTKIIAFENAYHGDTFGAMSVSARSVFNNSFSSLLFDVIYIPAPTAENKAKSIEALQKIIAKEKNKIAAIIYEPMVQGAGGMIMHNAKTLNSIISICKKNNIICIADEVMTGFGRTGKLFASDHLKNKPDIMCLSKGITGGFLPLGVTSCTNNIYNAFLSSDKLKTLFHGHSYTANPIACAAAVASLELFENKSTRKNIDRISKKHAIFLKQIKRHTQIKDIRHLGTILAIELQTQKGSSYLSEVKYAAYNFFLKHGILMRPLGNIIYLLPPYCISNKDLDYIYKAIESFLSKQQ